MITKPDREPEEEEIEEISDAALYRHLIVNHVGLRDHYAAAALTGMLANPSVIGLTSAKIVADSLEFADQMIAHRDRM